MDKHCDGLCCPDTPRCTGRELIMTEVRAMQEAYSPGELSETVALTVLKVIESHRGEHYNRMRAALAVAAALNSAFNGYGPGLRQHCLAEADRVLTAVFAVRTAMRDALIAQAVASLATQRQGEQ
jgi:hypothetical protein